MKNNIGIWIDTKQAIVVKLSNNHHSFKKIESNIVIKERVPGESKKFGRFGGQYLTYEKNRKNKKKEQIGAYLKTLFKELSNSDSIVIFGPSNMKNILAKEIQQNLQLKNNLVGVANSDQLTDNQIVAWVKNFYSK
jgi:hypothetical protein